MADSTSDTGRPSYPSEKPSMRERKEAALVPLKMGSSIFSRRARYREHPSRWAYSCRKAIRRLPRFRLGTLATRRKDRSSW